jgi:hypothetical protein
MAVYVWCVPAPTRRCSHVDCQPRNAKKSWLSNKGCLRPVSGNDKQEEYEALGVPEYWII